MSSTSFKATRADYAARWPVMTIPRNRRAALEAAVRRILKGRARYEAVAATTGVPWWWIGAIHNRESSCDFRGVLHNGERILNTGRKTRLKPSGRGPFTSWEQAARDALAIKNLRPGIVWTMERCLYEAERFNGFGYRQFRRIPSPYLWSFSNQYSRGKYVADGKWDASAIDEQIGVAPLLKALMEMVPDAQFAQNGKLPAKSTETLAIQQRLIIRGYDVGSSGTDGVMGPATRAAIRKFQRDKDLEADGIVGQLTRAALDDPPGRILSEAEIRAIQQRLRDLGYFEVGKLDGKWGPKTVGALVIFQAAQRPPLTTAPTIGRAWVDEATRAALTTAGPREVVPERASRTAPQLRQEGDKIAKTSWWGKVAAVIAGVPAVAAGVMEQLPSASEKTEGLTGLGLSGWVVLLAAVGGAVALYVLSQRTEALKVAAVREGRDAGPP